MELSRSAVKAPAIEDRQKGLQIKHFTINTHPVLIVQIFAFLNVYHSN
jgi:hypothetical protein